MVIKGGATDVVGSLGLGKSTCRLLWHRICHYHSSPLTLTPFSHIPNLSFKGGRAGATTVVDVVGSTDVDATTADEVERVQAHPQVGRITHVLTMLPQGEMMV